jgi:hypothetical protein
VRKFEISACDFLQPKGHPLALKLRKFIMSLKKSEAEAPPRKISTLFYCVPLTPEKSRVFFAFPRNFAKFVFNLSPRWLGHHMHMNVLDSDSYFLHLMVNLDDDLACYNCLNLKSGGDLLCTFFLYVRSPRQLFSS